MRAPGRSQSEVRVLTCPTCAPLVCLRPGVRYGDDWTGRPRWVVRAPDRLLGVRVECDDGRIAIGHRAITGGRRWQVTDFDDGGPIGDCRRDDLAVALDDRDVRGRVVEIVLAHAGPSADR